MFALSAQVFVFYYGMFCDSLSSRQIILSLTIKKLLYVMQTFEDIIYQFVACKNRVLFAFNSDNQRNNGNCHKIHEIFLIMFCFRYNSSLKNSTQFGNDSN